MINEQIYSTSLDKAIKRAKVYGNLDLRILNLFYLYMYYINYIEELIALGSTQFNEHIIHFKKMISKLMYKYPDIICNYKVVVIENPSIPENTPPRVDSLELQMESALQYPFELSRFTYNYQDDEGHSWKYLIVYPETLIHGKLYRTTNLGPVEITQPFQLNVEDLVSYNDTNIYYERTNYNVFTGEKFGFRVSDNPVNYLFSTLEYITLNALEPYTATENLPPEDIGDLTLYVNHGVTTVLTLDMFTNQLIAPYNDPEGDLIDAIRIIDISNANQGTYYYNGEPLSEGQIITREDLNNGLFTHQGADVNTVTSDTLEFEARDEGSQIWVG